MSLIKTYAAALAMLMTAVSAGLAQDVGGVREILNGFLADYESDPSMLAGTFGIDVDGSWWHVVARPGDEGSAPSVELREGEPSEPSFYFTLDHATLFRGHVLAHVQQGAAGRPGFDRAEATDRPRAAPAGLEADVDDALPVR